MEIKSLNYLAFTEKCFTVIDPGNSYMFDLGALQNMKK